MLKTDCLRVSMLDIIRCCGKAKENNEDPLVIEHLTDLFVHTTGTEACIPKDSEEARCFLKYHKIIVHQNCITLESLSLAFCRLYFGKNNKELLKRIEKYYRQFCENIKHDEDNTLLKQEIILDDEAFQFIKQFSNYEDYEKNMTTKSYKNRQLEKIKSEIKGKAIID